MVACTRSYLPSEEQAAEDGFCHGYKMQSTTIQHVKSRMIAISPDNEKIKNKK